MAKLQKRPIVLVILDGWGIWSETKGNAIAQANLKNIPKYWNIYPHTQLLASEEAVGLPKGECGNSEAGHLNLGAGRIVYQSLPRINMSIADGTFFNNHAFLAAINHVKKNNSNLHLIGLIGAGGVHSNIEHIFALLRLLGEKNCPAVYLHLFTDGRDSPTQSSLKYLKMCEEKIGQNKVGQIATLMGRYWAMDRDNRWKRTKIAYEALTQGEGVKTKSWEKTIRESYKNKITDEFIKPIIIVDENNTPFGLISSNDAVIFFNYRVDRPRQLTKAFVLPNFEKPTAKKAHFDPYAEKYGKTQYEITKTKTFQRKKILKNLQFITMTEYEPGLPALPAFPPQKVNMPFSRVIANKDYRQLHISETEKERHVGYYFNGKREDTFVGEERIVIPSPQVPTYDLKPEMSAYEVTSTLINKISSSLYDFIIVNLANPDMVGHTGNLQAGIKTCQVTDECVEKIVHRTLGQNGVCLITADHGNVEEMIDLPTGEIDTKHSTNPVPFIVAGRHLEIKRQVLNQGILADVAPTMLKLAGLTKPSSMTGESLI